MAFRAPWHALLVVAVLASCGSDASLLVPAWELSVGDSPLRVAVELPAHLDDGRVPDRDLHYYLRTSVTLPPAWRSRALQLVIPDLAAVARLRVDGSDAVDLGTSSKGYRRRGPHAWSIPPEAASDGTLRLELAVTHTWTQSAWWGTVPRLLPADESDSAATRVYILNLLASSAALVALAQIGLASLMIYFSDRRRRVYLPFGVQALAATVYPLFVAGWTQSLVGIYDAPLLAIALVFAGTVSIHFTHDLAGLPRPWRGFWWMCGVVCAMALVFTDPFLTTRVTGVATIVLVAFVMVYQVALCVRLLRARNDRKSVVYLLLSWLTLVVTGAPDFMWWLGFGDVLGGVRLTSIGLAFFAVFLSLLLSQKHVHSLKDSDGLNAELARRVDQLEVRRTEIENLNEELRRQIADRASQIYAAVALAATQRGTTQLVPGDMVQGRYRVERPVGSGGMGTIYEVTRASDGRKLALKLPREVHGQSLARLAREAQIASTLSHPNIVAVVDVDVASAGFLYLVMELVEGTSLDRHRHRFGDVQWALHVLAQIADGLAALHRVGIVHRDLKPANVLVTSNADPIPAIKISDFGISLHEGGDLPDLLPAPLPTVEEVDDGVTSPGAPAPSEVKTEVLSTGRKDQGAATSSRGRSVRARIASSSFLTRTGHLPGTPAYMAPELSEGRKSLSSATDLFSFGVIAQELLTGRRPFAEAPILAVLERRAVPVPSAIEDGWRDCPAPLAAALDACLSLTPAERPTAGELVMLLQSAIAGAR